MKKLTQTNEPDQKGLEPDENITIGGLEPAWPLGSDSVSQGDDHIRLLKLALQNTFSAFAEFETTNISPDELNFIRVAFLDESEDGDGTAIVIGSNAIEVITRIAGALLVNDNVTCDGTISSAGVMRSEGDITAFYNTQSSQNWESISFEPGENIHTFLALVSKNIDSSNETIDLLESRVADLEATIRVLSGGA